MAKDEMTLRRYRNEIVRNMRRLGTYREEFDRTIERTAALYVQQDRIERQFAESGGNAVVRHTNKAGATNAVKNPFLTARDEVYTQLLEHEKELGLTPAALRRLRGDALRRPDADPLAEALRRLDSG